MGSDWTRGSGLENGVRSIIVALRLSLRHIQSVDCNKAGIVRLHRRTSTRPSHCTRVFIRSAYHGADRTAFRRALHNGEPIGESPRNESIVWNVILKDPIAARRFRLEPHLARDLGPAGHFALEEFGKLCGQAAYRLGACRGRMPT